MLYKKVEYTDEQVTGAIAILISECFPALAMANAFSGSQTPEWEIIWSFSVDEIFGDAIERCLKLRGLRAAVGGRRIEDSWAKKYLPKPVDTQHDDGSSKWVWKND